MTTDEAAASGPSRAGWPRPWPGQDGLLVAALPGLRWGVLAVAMAIAVAWPVAARTGHPVWLYLLIFVAYNLAVEAFRSRLGLTYGRIAGFDLAVAGLVYAFDAEPAGPLFITFYIGVITAAIGLPPPAPSFTRSPRWSPRRRSPRPCRAGTPRNGPSASLRRGWRCWPWWGSARR